MKRNESEQRVQFISCRTTKPYQDSQIKIDLIVNILTTFGF